MSTKTTRDQLCFEVAKASHMTSAVSLDAARGDVSDGFNFVLRCFKQLEGPLDTDGPAFVAKEHLQLRLIGPSKSGKSEFAKLLARAFVASAKEPLLGRWMEMEEQITPDASRRTVWTAKSLASDTEKWGPLRFMMHLAWRNRTARYALILPESNRGDVRRL